MHPLCLRPSYHKSVPKITLSRPSFNSLPVHACAVRWKSSIQHLPNSQKNHFYETAITSPTALSTSQKLENIVNLSVEPAAALTSIQQPKVYRSPFDDPHALMTIDPRYPDRLKKE